MIRYFTIRKLQTHCIVKKVKVKVKFTYNRPRRPRGGVEV
jgi:hypothetical protein